MRGGISKGELYQKKYSKRYCKPKTTRTNPRRNYQGWFEKKLTARGPRKFPTESYFRAVNYSPLDQVGSRFLVGKLGGGSRHGPLPGAALVWDRVSRVLLRRKCQGIKFEEKFEEV